MAYQPFFALAITPAVALAFVSAIESEDYKKTIRIHQEQLTRIPEDKQATYIKELALLYLKDQDQEKAFEVFLQALDLCQSANVQDSLFTPYDEEAYRKVLAIYLDPSSESTQATAQQLIQEVRSILQAKSDQHILEYFMAIAYANLGKYADFFEHFYSAYRYYPDHYLAYKTKAILHLKLLERTRDEGQRNIQRQKIIDNLHLAIEREPSDITIYRLLITFSPKEKKRELVQLSLNKIINGNIIIPRTHLMFYVIEATDIKDPELAQRFISRAKEWYPESRIAISAQKYLDAHK